MLKKYLFIIMIMGASAITSSEAYAIIIGPARFEARLPAGEIAGADYYVQNETDETVHIVVDAENRGNYEGLPVDKWLTPDISEFDLKPKEIRKIKMTIRTPKNVKGEVAAQIYFTSIVKDTENISAGGVRARLGAVLYVAVKGTEIANLELYGINIMKKVSDGKDVFDILLPVANLGNVHILPSAIQVLIEDRNGTRIAKLDVPLDKSFMPNDSGEYKVSWENPALKPGTYFISASIKYGKMYGREKTAKFEKLIEVDKDGKVASK